MQKEGYPAVDEPGCTITAWTPGASPEDMEINVTMKIEDAIKEVEGIKSYSSESMENFIYVIVQFEDDYDFNDIKDEIRRNLDTISDFPEEMTNRPVIHEWGAKHMDLMKIGFYSRGCNYKELKNHYKELKQLIEDSPYITDIDSHGELFREIQIRVDYEKLNEYYISFDEVINAISSHNVQVTGGTLESSTSEKNIVTISKFENPLDVGKVIIRSNRAGDNVTLADVAEIEDTFGDIDWVIRFNGNTGILIEVFKKNSADIVKSAEAVKKIIEDYRQIAGDAKIGIDILVDQSDATRSRLSIVKNNAVLGLLLVGLLLFLFLNFKNALWTVLGIPFSIAFGLLFISGLGITINSVTLLAMIIVLGMIVDDAIVISENIHRHRIINGPGAKVVTQATLEVGFAVLTTILTTLIAFIPLYFMKGVIGAYVKEIPIVISLLLIGSLVESLFILPSHISHTTSTFQRRFLGFIIGALLSYFSCQLFELSSIITITISCSGALLFTILFSKFYKETYQNQERSYVLKMREIYGRALHIILRFRYIVLCVMISLFILGALIATSMKFEMFPSVEANRLRIAGDIKGYNSLEYTQKVIKKMEDYINQQYKDRGMKSLVSYLGGASTPEHFELHLLLTPENQRDLKTDDIIEHLRTKFTDDIYDRMEYIKSDGGPQLGNNIVIEISGNNDEYRKTVASIVNGELEKIEGTLDINRTDTNTKPEIKIVPIYDRIAAFGVTAAKIAQLTRIAFSGYTVTHLQTAEEEIPYQLLLKKSQRMKIESLKNLTIPTATRNLEKIGSMIHVVEGTALTKIKRYNSKRTTTLVADFDSSKIKSAELYAILSDKFKDIPAKYPGIRVHLGGAAEISNEAFGSLQSTLVVAIAGIFVLLIFLFRSLTQPLIVIIAIPFGLLGVIFSFKMHGMPLSFMGVMGTIGLSGVVVNDSLIMVEYINQLKARYKESGRNLKDLVLEGAKTRLRPIILTTATTFVGLLPTAYGLGGNDPLILPAAIALSWGLFFSTTMVLLFLPTFYLIEDDIRQLLNRKKYINNADTDNRHLKQASLNTSFSNEKAIKSTKKITSVKKKSSKIIK